MPLPPLVAPVAALDLHEQARTARHAMLAGFGELGQRRLAAAHVAVVGAGGLGSPVVLALAAAGIGTLTVIDDDNVELSNLQRQVLHRTTDIGRPKVASATRVAADLSPSTNVRTLQERLTADNAERLLGGADLVIDGSDTFDTRVMVAAACETLGVPLVWGVVQEFHAQVTIFWNQPPVGHLPVTLADLYPADSVGEVPTCAQVGVLGALCLQAGAIMSVEAIKLITGTGNPLFGRVAIIDALRGTQTEVPLRPSTATSEPAKPHTSIPQVLPAEVHEAQVAGATLIDVREPVETATGIIPGSILIPLADLLADPTQVGAGPHIIICKAGSRAERAAIALQKHNITASVLTGGIDAWNAESALV